MSLFDRYRPVPPLVCPACGRALDDWEGTEGPCGLFVWEQGHDSPVDQLVVEESRTPLETASALRLPDVFEFWADCPGCYRAIGAVGRSRDGVWVESALLSPSNARPCSRESDREFRARLRALGRLWEGRG